MVDVYSLTRGAVIRRDKPVFDGIPVYAVGVQLSMLKKNDTKLVNRNLIYEKLLSSISIRILSRISGGIFYAIQLKYRRIRFKYPTPSENIEV